MASKSHPDPIVSATAAPAIIDRLLRAPGIALVARVLLTAAFWTSGFAKLADFTGATAEMASLGLPAPGAVAALVIFVQLAGSALVILNRWTWLGAGALAVFTILATLLAHAFWNAPPADWGRQFATFMEHLGLVGGFMLVAILASRRGR